MAYRNKGYTNGNSVRLICGGRNFFDLLTELIDNSEDTIHLQTYILQDDETGNSVIDALTEAAKRGVAVYVMADGYASQGLPDAVLLKAREAGIKFRFFEPLLKSRNFYFGRRLHHKVFVADSTHALVGGRNIADRYNDLPDHPAWLDFAVHVQGSIAKELCVLCTRTWNGFLPHRDQQMRCNPVKKFVTDKTKDCLVRMRVNDWVRKRNQVARSYAEMLLSARDSVTILCSYFLPGIAVTRRLVRAAQRGVKVNIIMAGRSDVMIAKHAERYIYRKLLSKNINVYEYLPNVLHGKVAVCDDEWMTIGSYNVNNLSAYASIELNLDIRSAGIAKEMHKTLQEIIDNDCLKVTKEYIAQHSNMFHLFIRWISYQTISLLVYLCTFYFKQRD